MGEVIYLNPKSERFYREFERQVRDTLGLLGDEKGAPWVVSTIRRLLEMPEFNFSCSIALPSGISKEDSQSIESQCSQALHQFASNLKCGMVRELLESYVDRAKGQT